MLRLHRDVGRITVDYSYGDYRDFVSRYPSGRGTSYAQTRQRKVPLVEAQPSRRIMSRLCREAYRYRAARRRASARPYKGIFELKAKRRPRFPAVVFVSDSQRSIRFRWSHLSPIESYKAGSETLSGRRATSKSVCSEREKRGGKGYRSLARARARGRDSQVKIRAFVLSPRRLEMNVGCDVGDSPDNRDRRYGRGEIGE